MGELDGDNRCQTPLTRPDSPTSSTEEADVDWTYAKREAAFARLGLDPTFDDLPDEDLNKLFEKISPGLELGFCRGVGRGSFPFHQSRQEMMKNRC